MKNTLKTVNIVVATMLVMQHTWIILLLLWLALGAYGTSILWRNNIIWRDSNKLDGGDWFWVVILCAAGAATIAVVLLIDAELREIFANDFKWAVGKVLPNKKVSFQWPVKIESVPNEVK